MPTPKHISLACEVNHHGRCYGAVRVGGTEAEPAYVPCECECHEKDHR